MSGRRAGGGAHGGVRTKVVETSFMVVGGVFFSWRRSRYTIVQVPVSGNSASRSSEFLEHAAMYIPTDPSVASFQVGLTPFSRAML